MAKYDLPASIDFVLQRTKRKSLSYIGHSQGTTQMFAALAENIDKMIDKINVFIALAPITYNGGSHNAFLRTMSVSLPMIYDFLASYSLYELFGPDWEGNIHKSQVCSWFPESCLMVVPSGVPGNEFENMFWRRVAN